MFFLRHLVTEEQQYSSVEALVAGVKELWRNSLVDRRQLFEFLVDPLCTLLWDVDAATIDPDVHRSFLIGRILSAGSLEAIRWARRTYGDDAIRAWIVAHEGRQLSGPQIRLWETLIGLPAEAVAAWLAVPERRIWEGRGAS